MTSTPLLELRGVSRSFGRVRAVADVSTSIEEGEVRGLIGPNGAGKTTLINVLTGFMPASSGSVLLGGTGIDGRPAHARVRAGLGRTFQTPQLSTAMSVLDNIVVGAHQRLGCARFRSLLPGGRRTSLRALRAEAAAVGGEVGLGDALDTPAGALSYGHMRLLEIARALMGRPRLLLLDEPIAGMNEAESEPVGTLIRALPARGTSVLLVEHDMSFVMGVCERITVLDHGVLLAEGTPHEVRHDARVQEAYLGSSG
ncbi:MAG: branched-chain amino acid transport system ATP-binding protein [Actinomycetota bacterium]